LLLGATLSVLTLLTVLPVADELARKAVPSVSRFMHVWQHPFWEAQVEQHRLGKPGELPDTEGACLEGTAHHRERDTQRR
jgi:hypothetical protein